jgi:hypothetical protein
VLTLYGILALTFMMTMYALEARGPRFVLAFAFGCCLASVYGFLTGAWPFGSWRSSGPSLQSVDTVLPPRRRIGA